MLKRIRLFLLAKIAFDEATCLEEYVVPVDVLPDGSVVDEDDNYFSATNW